MKYALSHCVAFRLRRLSRIADGHIRKVLSDHKITENQVTLLFTLHEMGRVEQGKIGEALCLERSTISRNFKLLEKQGLVVRTNDYRPEVELTEKGIDLAKTIIPKWEKAMDILMGTLNDEGMGSLKNLEKRML
ncbi:MarR family winged helix-turn-helix transcriptional regulator [Croceitalea sp. MTPC5]|uniref:MarR family winged helix-turn-helix transcriptional regulator n=1 Tax=Croceitalea sp. MTPC5 TaxID=3056565 RepID=UPI002B3E5CA6|nr:MarR family winged helix-turn-helix transcriptional regulator [Croceitalea sp. MTPC5]